MIRTRGRKILRDILSRKGRTALVAISIMIGVFGAVTLISANDLLIKQIKQDINPDEVAMIRMFVTVPSAGTNVQTVDGEDQVLHLVRSNLDADIPPSGIAGVTDIEGQVVAPVYWRMAGTENRFRDADMMAFSEPFGSIGLEPMRLLEGDWPAVGASEIAIERRMAEEYDLGIGDTMEFRQVGGAGSEAQAWTISAMVFHPYWVETGGNNAPQQRIFAHFEDAQQIAGFTGYSTYYLRYVDTTTAERQADSLKELLRSETNYIPQGYWLDDPDNYFLIGEVQEITSVLNMLAVVALVVSGFLVTNVINTIVLEQKRQIGVMKSIGATRLDNFTVYAGIALLYGVLGTVPGVILGIITGSTMAVSVAPLAHTYIEGFNISTTGLVFGALMGLLVPVLAALIPVINGTRVSIMDAMTDLGISGSWGQGPLARIIKRLPLPTNIRQALSNVMQKKGRLVLTVLTLTFAAAAFMGVFAMFTVVTDEINKLFDTFNYEILVIPTEAQDFEQVSSRILSNDAVEAVYPGVAFGVRILDLDGTILRFGPEEHDEIQALGIEPDSGTLSLTYDAGSGWQDAPNLEGIVLTSSAADEIGKSVGDQVVIEAGGRSKQFEVIGIGSYPFPLAIMRWQDLSQLAGFVYDAGTPDDPGDDEPLPVVFFTKLAQADPSVAEVSDTIDELSETLLDSGVTAAYANQVEEQQAIADNMMVFNMIFQITSAVMAAVGAIGLLTTLSMAVYERQKEIGVMRSIGAGSGTIITQFLVEGLLIGVLAWALAVPLSYLLAVSLLDGMGLADFIDFSYPLWVLGLGIGGMLIVATVASLWPSIAAARRTVSDILRYQ